MSWLGSLLITTPQTALEPVTTPHVVPHGLWHALVRRSPGETPQGLTELWSGRLSASCPLQYFLSGLRVFYLISDMAKLETYITVNHISPQQLRP